MRDEPSPLNDVAVHTPVILTPLVSVVNLLNSPVQLNSPCSNQQNKFH